MSGHHLRLSLWHHLALQNLESRPALEQENVAAIRPQQVAADGALPKMLAHEIFQSLLLGRMLMP